jgi:hypothetical protein
MKWIKTYKIFESKEDIIQTVKDILLPISDLDYSISVTKSPLYHQDFNMDSLIGYELVIRVVTYIDKSLVITDDIKQDFITMKEYLESEGFSSIEALYVRTGSSYTDLGTKHNQMKVDFNEFISMEDCELRNLLFVAKKIE